MFGIDTVKLVAPMVEGRSRSIHLNPHLEPLPRGKGTGRKGPVWWNSYRVPDLNTTVTVKGCGAASAYLLWEGSVPKILGLAGVAQASDVLAWEQSLAEVLPAFHSAHRSRVDVTADVTDPDAVVRACALGWKPHERARYVQAVYQGLETVWLHNKTRGVRLYDKYAECGQPWAEGMTRVEYQIRGDWVKRHGLATSTDTLEVNASLAIMPLLMDLRDRALSVGYVIPEVDSGLVAGLTSA